MATYPDQPSVFEEEARIVHWREKAPPHTHALFSYALGWYLL